MPSSDRPGQAGGGKAPLTEDEVRTALQKVVSSYESGSKDFFNQFADDASLFTVSAPTRVDSREEYERGFGPVFYDTKRVAQVLSPEIRLLGNDAAVATFHNRVQVGGVANNLRATFVFQRNPKGELKVVHVHNSPLGHTAAPSVSRTPSELDDVTVLEERVAAASAAVGTPK